MKKIIILCLLTTMFIAPFNFLKGDVKNSEIVKSKHFSSNQNVINTGNISANSLSIDAEDYQLTINDNESFIAINDKNYKDINSLIKKLKNTLFKGTVLIKGKKFNPQNIEKWFIIESNLKSLDGVEKLKNLKTLYIANNDLDLSENSKTMKKIRKLEKKGVEVIYLPEEDEL